MKVLFVSNDPAIFNSANPARERMRLYAAAIGELHIVSAAPAGTEELQEGGLFLYPAHSSKLMRVFALEKRAHALILERHIEVVSAQDPFEHGLAAMRAVRGTNAKLHIQVHTDFLSRWFTRSGNIRSPKVRMPFLNRIRRRIAHRVLPQADGVRVVSERIKRSLLEYYGASIREPVVIPVPVPFIMPDRVPLPAHPFTFSLIVVGRLEPEKRIEDILQALKLVAGHYHMVGLFIVGDGSERPRLERMAHRLGIAPYVVFLGNRTDAWGLMRSAQVFIQASAYEGYGRTIVEAALAQMPIITTEVGVVGEVFRGYQDVLSAPVADPTALSLHIVGLLEDNQVREELARNAEAAARRHLAAAGDIPARIAADLGHTLQQS